MTPKLTSGQILDRLRAGGSPEAVAGMARFGIASTNTLGVSIPNLRGLAKEAGRNHRVALELWDSGIHEARILASMVDDPKAVTEAQMDAWVADFDSWDVCDQVCSNLFRFTPYADKKCIEWSEAQKTFVKHAAFALIASLAAWDKSAPDGRFEAFLPLIIREAADDRNFVKKAVNWALRQIGKRNAALNRSAVAVAEQLLAMDSKAARWIFADTLRELKSPALQGRLNNRDGRRGALYAPARGDRRRPGSGPRPPPATITGLKLVGTR